MIAPSSSAFLRGKFFDFIPALPPYIHTLDHIYVLAYISAMNITPNALFTALSSEIRLRSLLLMQQEGELCVCELIYALGLSQPMISRHLAILRDNYLVIDRRSGQWIYYSINPELSEWAQQVLQTTTLANRQLAPFSDDLDALNAMPNRPNSACCA